jgi:O-antigen/teichoic acid export membrane protein
VTDAVHGAAAGVDGSPTLGSQSRAVAAWKVAEYAGLALFTVALPRAMGPAQFGRFAALVSLVGLLAMAAALGAQATFGRFVPEYHARGEPRRIRALFTQLFALRLAVALFVAALLLLFHARLLPGSSRATGAVAAAAFVSVALGAVCYQLLYGLNQLGRSLVHDGLARLLLVALVFALAGLHDLDRAAAALVLAEFALLLVGLAWARGWFDVAAARALRADLPHQLGFGLGFFGANLLLLAVWRGGELAVLYLSGNSAEVAYYSIANAAALTLAMLLGQLLGLLLPQLTSLATTGRTDDADRLLGAAVKYLTMAAFAFLLLINGLGRWLVELVLGAPYLPVVDNLRILAVAVLPVALLRAAMTTAMVRKEPRRALAVAAAGLTVFGAVAAVTVPLRASPGASLAAVAATTVTAAVGAWRFRLAPVLRLARYGRLVMLGAGAAALSALSWGPAPARLALAAALFGATLFAFRVIEPAELRRLVTAMRPRRGPGG